MRRAALVMAIVFPSMAAGPPQAARPKDPQAAIEPRSKPGEGQAFLARMAGDWDVIKTFHPRQGGPVRAAGRCRQEMIHGGRFLRSEFTFGQGDAATTGTGLIGFEPESGRFTSTWVDSRQTRMSLRRSVEPFDGEQVVLESRSLEPGDDERRSRTVTRIEDDGRRIVHRQYAVEAGTPGRLVMELVLTRREADPAGSR